MSEFIPIKRTGSGAPIEKPESERLTVARAARQARERSEAAKPVVRSVSDKQSAGLIKERERLELLSMYTDVRNPRSFREIAEEMNRRHSEAGIKFRYTEKTVGNEVREALSRVRRQTDDDVAMCVSMARTELLRIIRNAAEDYEASRRADAKTEANLLRTMLRDGNFVYDDAMDLIEMKRYSGNTDYQRVLMEALDRLLDLMGVPRKPASQVQPQQVAENIVNYNFDALGMDKMREIVRGMQDGKYKEIRSEAKSAEEQ